MGAEYWIVDLEAEVLERWLPGSEHPEVLANVVDWRAEGAGEALVIDLRELFLEAGGGAPE